MFRYLLSDGSVRDYIINLLLTLPIIVFSLTVHEYSHARVAQKMGDETAANFGRLTLNPLKHLDPIGTLCMVLFGFGWAKPVPVNSRNFRNPRRGMALTAAAGPLSNLALGFVFSLLYVLTYRLALRLLPPSAESVPAMVDVAITFLYLGMLLNVYLAVFNLLPIPPFDGSRIFFIFLPTKWYFAIMKYERWIMIGVLVLLWTGIIQIPFGWIAGKIINLMTWLWSLVFAFI